VSYQCHAHGPPSFWQTGCASGLILLAVACELLHLAGAVQELHELAAEDPRQCGLVKQVVALGGDPALDMGDLECGLFNGDERGHRGGAPDGQAIQSDPAGWGPWRGFRG